MRNAKAVTPGGKPASKASPASRGSNMANRGTTSSRASSTARAKASPNAAFNRGSTKGPGVGAKGLTMPYSYSAPKTPTGESAADRAAKFGSLPRGSKASPTTSLGKGVAKRSGMAKRAAK